MGRRRGGTEVQEGRDIYTHIADSQVALAVKNLPASAGDIRDLGSISGLGGSPGGGHGNPFQYFCMESPTDRGT